MASLTLRDNDRSAHASLSPTRLVNTSRLWLTGHVDFFGKADLFQGFAEHAVACITCKRYADGLGDERYGAGGARSDTFFVGVPAHICAVGLYCNASRAHLRYARAALATKPRYASLVPKGSLSQTQ